MWRVLTVGGNTVSHGLGVFFTLRVFFWPCETRGRCRATGNCLHVARFLTFFLCHTNTYPHPHSYPYTHTNTHAHTHIHTHSHSLTHTHTHTLTHIQTHTQTHTNTHRQTDRRTHTHTHTYTRTQAQTHTQVSSFPSISFLLFIFPTLTPYTQNTQFQFPSLVLSISSCLSLFSFFASPQCSEKRPTL